MIEILRFNVGPLDNNTYLVIDLPTGQAAIVDPSFESRPVWDTVVERGFTLSWVLNTHAHIDHVVENAYFVAQSRAPLALHRDDETFLEALPEQAAWLGIESPALSTPTYRFTPGESIEVGESRLTVVHTPGHSPGSVSFLAPGIAIVGDVLFAGGIGRTDLPGGNLHQLLHSIRRELLSLPDETVVYPGHGDLTTIGRERESNPFL